MSEASERELLILLTAFLPPLEEPLLDAEDQSVYLHDAWTIGGPLDMNRLYLQLLPVYTWAKEGVERNQGLKDVQIIEINIYEKSEHSGRK